MTSTQEELVAAPGDNLVGVRQATHQLWKINQPGWTLKYDHERDTLFLRAPQQRPAITYFDPETPELEFRLDVAGAELVGVDFVNCHELAKKSQQFARTLRYVIWTERFRHVPGFHRLMRRVARGLRGEVSDDLQMRMRPSMGT